MRINKLLSFIAVTFTLETALAAGPTMIDQTILYASRYPISAVQDAVRKVLPSGLEIWIRRRPGPREGKRVNVLYFMGSGERAEEVTYQTSLMDLMPPNLEVVAWYVNYPGYGGSSGEAKLESFPKAGLDAYDALAQDAGNTPVLIYGYSIGGPLALYVASQRQPTALLLLNPVPLKEVILLEYGWWNLWLVAGPLSLLVPQEFDSVKISKKLSVPALFLSAENDQRVPRKYQEMIVKKYAGHSEEIILKDCGHEDGVPSEYFTRIQASLLRTLGLTDAN